MRILGSGTLVVALISADGVYLAADSRRTGCYDDANKLFQLGPHTIGAIRGHAMLLDNEKVGNDRMFARHFVDLVPGPLPLERAEPDADWIACQKADGATKFRLRNLLSKQLKHIEADWHDEPLTTETLDMLATEPAILSLTIAQSQTDGWLFLVDVACEMTLEGSRIIAELWEPQIIYNGPYTEIALVPFPPPECRTLCPIVDTTRETAVAIIDHAFARTLDMSSCCCAKHVGGPTDIAITSAGVVRVVRHKCAAPPYF
jgi:hypothetical protein